MSKNFSGKDGSAPWKKLSRTPMSMSVRYEYFMLL